MPLYGVGPLEGTIPLEPETIPLAAIKPQPKPVPFWKRWFGWSEGCNDRIHAVAERELPIGQTRYRQLACNSLFADIRGADETKINQLRNVVSGCQSVLRPYIKPRQ